MATSGADGSVKIKVEWDGSDIKKDAAKTKTEIEKQLAGTTASAKVDIDDSSLDDTEKKINELDATITPKIDVDAGGLDQAQKQIDGLKGESVTIPVDADTSGFSSAVSGALGALGAGATVFGTQEYREDIAKLENNAITAGESIANISEELKELNGISSETDSNVEALSNLLDAGFKGEQLSSVVDSLSGAVLKFPDTLKIEGVADGLQETLATGSAIGPFAELIERLGGDLEVFDAGLAAAKEEGDELNYVMGVLEDFDLADVNDQYRELNSELIESKDSQFELNEQFAEIGETILPIVTDVTTVFANLLGVLVENKDAIFLIGSIVGGAVVAFNAYKAAVAAAQVVTALLNGTLALNPIGIVITAIGALIAGFIYLWNTSEAFREFWIGLWNGIVEFFSGIVNAIVGFFTETIPNAVGFVWEVIKDIFTKIGDFIAAVFEGLVNIIKAPFNGIIALVNTLIGAVNFVISGLNTLSFDIPDWVPFVGGQTWGFNIPAIPEIPYLAQGGIVPSATLAMIGENGTEAVVPLENNLGWLDKIAAMLAERMQLISTGGGNVQVIFNEGRQDPDVIARKVRDVFEYGGTI